MIKLLIAHILFIFSVKKVTFILSSPKFLHIWNIQIPHVCNLSAVSCNMTGWTYHYDTTAVYASPAQLLNLNPSQASLLLLNSCWGKKWTIAHTVWKQMFMNCLLCSMLCSDEQKQAVGLLSNTFLLFFWQPLTLSISWIHSFCLLPLWSCPVVPHSCHANTGWDARCPVAHWCRANVAEGPETTARYQVSRVCWQPGCAGRKLIW